MRKLLFKVALPFLGLGLLLAPASAAAWNPFGGGLCKQGQAEQSAVCQADKQGDPIAGSNGLIIKIANLIAIIAAIAAVILIIIGGIKYAISGGDTNDVTSAKNTVLYALIGLVVIALARTLIVFIVNRIQE